MATRKPASRKPATSVVRKGTPDAAPDKGTRRSTAPSETRATEPAYLSDSGERGKNITPFTAPDLERCPKCVTGLLYVIGYDESALHEAHQPIYAPNMLSGGMVQVTCFVCGHGETHALNPTEAPANPNPGA